MNITLNHQQAVAVKECMKWWKANNRARNYFEIAGPAGSGKSTVAYYMINELNIPDNKVMFVTFTGKAALSLTRKGCPTRTIHSVFYQLVHEKKLDDNGELITNDQGKPKYRKVFKKRETLEYDLDLVVIDEGSMVSDKIAQDLLSFNIPIIILGDLEQLPPVLGESFFLRYPDVVLTEILRQKKGDPIIYLSQKAINDERIEIGQYGDNCRVISKDSITDELMNNVDIILCGRNVTRENLNNHMRRSIYKYGNNLEIGEKIICRKNNWNLKVLDDIYLINGLNGYVDGIEYDTFNIGKHTVEIDFRPEFLEDEYFYDIKIDLEHLYGFEDKKGFQKFNTANIFEWGYVITTHLAQGSQYGNILIYNEKMGPRDSCRKWLYTAITRAEWGLTLAI